MKILKLLNKRNLSIIIVYLISTFSVNAEDKPIDIWNIDTINDSVVGYFEKKNVKVNKEINIPVEKTEVLSQSSIYEMQVDKIKKPIKLDQNLVSKEIKIAGLYDPEDYGLSIDMWSNSDGQILKKLFGNIDKYELSKDASDILNISLLTNAYYPNQNITEQEFLKFKSNWLIKESRYD